MVKTNFEFSTKSDGIKCPIIHRFVHKQILRWMGVCDVLSSFKRIGNAPNDTQIENSFCNQYLTSLTDVNSLGTTILHRVRELVEKDIRWLWLGGVNCMLSLLQCGAAQQ